MLPSGRFSTRGLRSIWIKRKQRRSRAVLPRKCLGLTSQCLNFDVFQLSVDHAEAALANVPVAVLVHLKSIEKLH